MNIGIDIDNTITCSIETILEYLEIFKKDYLKDGNLEDVFMEFINGSIHNPIVRSFYHNNCLDMASKFELKENAKEIIDKLHEEGNRIVIITARSDENYIDAYKYCEDYLKDKKIYYDKLIVAQQTKVQACIDEQIDIMIDDSIDICEEARAVNVNSLVFNSKVNQHRVTNLPRVSTWKEAYEYIQNFKKNK